MDLDRARCAAEKAQSKKEAERQRLQEQLDHQTTIDGFNAEWNAWAGTWKKVVLSRERGLTGEAELKELAFALAVLVEVTRERELIDSLPIALAKYDPNYCDETADEVEAQAVGIMIDALNDVALGRSADEVAADLLSLDPLPPLERAASARRLLRVAEHWPIHCEGCGRIQTPHSFDCARCRECNRTEGKLVLLVSNVGRVHRDREKNVPKTADVFPFWPEWRAALLLAFPGVTSDRDLCYRWADFLTETLDLQPDRWQWIDLAEAGKLLPPPAVDLQSHGSRNAEDARSSSDDARPNEAGEDGTTEHDGPDDTEPLTGFLGGAALADAMGIHATRREAFFQQLGRRRISLGDDFWHEVRKPRPNSPRFLYRVDSSKLRELAAAYKQPKPL